MIEVKKFASEISYSLTVLNTKFLFRKVVPVSTLPDNSLTYIYLYLFSSLHASLKERIEVEKTR